MPSGDSYSAADITALNTHRTPIQKQPEALLCLVGLSRSYFLGNDAYLTFLYDDNRDMDLFNLTSAPNPTKVKTGTRPRVAHEVPLLTATASRVIDMEDTTVALRSSGTPFALEKSPLDFANESPPPLKSERDGMEDQVQDGLSPEILPVENPTTTEVVLEPDLEKEVAAIGPLVIKRHRKKGNDKADANAPPKVLRKDHAAFRPAQSARPDFCEESRVREIGLLSIRGRVTRRYLSARVKRDQQLPPGHPGRVPRYGRSHSIAGVAMGSQLRLRFEQKVKLFKKATTKIARQDQRIQAREEEIKKLDQEIKSLRAVEAEFLDFQVSNNQLSQQVSNLQAQVTGEEKIKSAFEEFKKYEDDKVEQRCAEMDARLDKLSMDFDEELYPHILTAIAGRRWFISHDLHLAVMKCSESLKLSQAFANVVSAGLVKDLKDLKYPLVDQLEGLKDAPMELIMASLYLESDSGEDAPSGSMTFALAPPN
ncbi:hypothetical protein Tco_0568693 [Tanacetum coccineum]